MKATEVKVPEASGDSSEVLKNKKNLSEKKLAKYRDFLAKLKAKKDKGKAKTGSKQASRDAPVLEISSDAEVISVDRSVAVDGAKGDRGPKAKGAKGKSKGKKGQSKGTKDKNPGKGTKDKGKKGGKG